MSFYVRMNDFFYGPYLGHPTLDSGQWALLMKRTRQVDGQGKRSLVGVIGGSVSLLLGAVVGALLGAVWVSTIGKVSVLVSVPALLACVTLQCMLTSKIQAHRMRPAMRRAANELGYATLCVECGYDLRKIEGDKCPECGAACR